MKQDFDSNTELSLGSSEIVTFGLEANANIFQLLSDKIYSDKPGAVVRELASNAADAHVQIGNTEPFQIELPNPFNQMFSIRDFGPGLSDEDIKNVYIYYGKSTKTDTNSQIGAFGIGAKSPFAYTKSFSIISRHKGKKTIYAAFVDPSSKMQLATTSSEDISEDDHGIEIQIPVDEKDYDVFKDKVATILAHFNPLPNVIGDPNFKFKKPSENAISIDKWQVPLSKNDEHNLYVIVGNLVYKVNTKELFSFIEKNREYKIDSEFMRYFEYNRNQLSVYFKFNIGDVEIAASREELSYTKKTLKAISESLVDFYENFYEAILKYSEKFTNQVDFLKFLNDFNGLIDDYNLKSFRKKLAESFKQARPNIHPEIFDGMMTFEIEDSFLYDFEFVGVQFRYTNRPSERDVPQLVEYIGPHAHEYSFKIPLSEYFMKKYVIMFVDEDITDAKLRKKIKQHRNASRLQNKVFWNDYLVIRRFLDVNEVEPDPTFAKARADFNNYISSKFNGFKIDMVTSSSIELPQAERKPRQKKEKENYFFKYQLNRGSLELVGEVDIEEVTSEDRKVFVLENRGSLIRNPENPENKISYGDIASERLFLEHIQYFYVLKPGYNKKRLQHNFVSFKKAMDEFMLTEFSKEELENYFKEVRFIKDFTQSNGAVSNNIFFWVWLNKQKLFTELDVEVQNVSDLLFSLLEKHYKLTFDDLLKEYNNYKTSGYSLSYNYYDLNGISESRRRFISKHQSRFENLFGISGDNYKKTFKEHRQFTESQKYFKIFSNVSNEAGFEEIFDIMILKSNAKKQIQLQQTA